MKKNLKKPYRTPETESAAAMQGAEMVCIVSPGDGSTEDLTYEEWEF